MRWLLVLVVLAGCAQEIVDHDAGPRADAPRVDVRAGGEAGTDVVTNGTDACAARDACGTTCGDTTTDVHNCGACGHDCTALPGVTATLVRCLDGACDATDACAAGRAHCSARADDGCETDITLPAHCGACATTCAAAMPMCTEATDGVYSCGTGCSAMSPTRCGGACVDPMTDAANCGHCGVACPGVVHGTASCAAGACDFTCTAGYHVCSTACATNTDVATCGAACTPCPAPANGTATCDGTACGIACNAGYVLTAGACMAMVVSTTVMFPSSTSSLTSTAAGFTGTVGGSPGTYFWRGGDTVQQSFPRAMAATNLSVSFQMNDLTSTYCGGGSVMTWNVLVNGTVVGTYSFPQGSGVNPRTVTNAYTFSPIAPAGGVFTLSFVATSTVCSGGGAWNWVAGGTATLQ